MYQGMRHTVRQIENVFVPFVSSWLISNCDG